MIRVYGSTITGDSTFDLLNSFINVVGEGNLTILEMKSTNAFLKNLRSNDLLDKFAYIHPFLGNSLTTKAYNLLDATKYNIIFSLPVSSVSDGVVFYTGIGTISNIPESGINSIDSSIGVYTPTYIKGDNVCDIGCVLGTQRHELIQYRTDTGGYTFYAGSNVDRVYAKVLINKLYVANSREGTMSLWTDGVMKTSQSGGESFMWPALDYNNGGVNNGRTFSFSYLATGLTGEEIRRLTVIVNDYMTALGRNVQ